MRTLLKSCQFIVLLCMAALAVPMVAYAAKAESGSGPLVPWRPYTVGLFQDASNEGKLIVIYIYSHHCAYSKRFSDLTLNNVKFLSYFNKHFVGAHVNSKRTPHVAKRYGVKYVPTFIVLDTHNVILGQFAGYKNVDWTLEFLEHIFNVYEYRRINQPITWMGERYRISQSILKEGYLTSLPPICSVVRCYDKL